MTLNGVIAATLRSPNSVAIGMHYVEVVEDMPIRSTTEM